MAPEAERADSLYDTDDILVPVYQIRMEGDTLHLYHFAQVELDGSATLCMRTLHT
mgnify:CR=1 FL=1